MSLLTQQKLKIEAAASANVAVGSPDGSAPDRVFSADTLAGY